MTSDEKKFLIFFIIIAALIRVPYLFQPVGWDEAVVYFWVKQRSLDQVLSDYSNIGNHIFFTFLMALSYYCFGEELWAIRLPVFLSGVLLVPATYLLAKQYSTRSVAGISAAMVGSINYLVFASSNARGYILQAFLVAVVFWLWGLYHENPKGKKLIGALFAITFALAFYTLPTTLFVAPAVAFLPFVFSFKDGVQGMSRAFRASLLPIGVAALLTILLYTPVLVSMGVSDVIGHDKLRPHSVAADSLFIIQRQVDVFWDQLFWGIPDSITFLVKLLALIGFCRFLIRGNPLSWIFGLSILTLVVISITFIRVGPSRSFVFYIPFLVIMIAGGLDLIHKWTLKKIRDPHALYFSAALFLLIAAPAVFTEEIETESTLYYARERGAKELVQDLSKKIRDTDYIVHMIPQIRYWIDYYKFEPYVFKRFSEKAFVNHKGERLFVITRPRREGVEKVLSRSRLAKLTTLDMTDFSEPQFINRYQDLALYLIEYKKNSEQIE